jgi:hypothetical protein
MGTAHTFKLLLFLLILFFISCTEEQPYSPQDRPGKIVGLVKPEEIDVRVDLYQGTLIKTVIFNSSDHFVIDSIFAGVYNLEFSAANYGRQILNEVTVYAGQVTTIPDIQLKPYPEQIMSFLPVSDDQQFPLTAPIQIQFSTLMDHNSVENNFSLLPGVNGKFSWEIVSGNSKLSFYPNDQYKSNQDYLMMLTTGAKTSYGQSLSFNFRSTFKTEGVKIMSTIPENNASFISPQTLIYVYFNSKMDHQSVEQGFSITPTKMGNFKWFDSRRVSFQPGSYLASNTLYTVTISSDVKDTFGSFLQQEQSFAFQTEPLRIISNYPTNGATSVSRSNPITITFNTYVNQDLAQKAFSLSPAISGWNFQWSDFTRFQYTGSTKLQANSSYTVTIDTTCSDEWGNLLASNFSFIFKTGD